MKRIGVLLVILFLLLACAVPAGAYQWSGESFLDDYYGAMPLDAKFDAGHFELCSFDGGRVTISGDYSGSYTVDTLPQQIASSTDVRLFYGSERVFLFPRASAAPFGSFVWEYSYSSCTVDFVFDTPVKSFLLSGQLEAYIAGGFCIWNSSTPLNGSNAFKGTVNVSVGDDVIKSFSGIGSSFFDIGDIYYESDTPIESFSLHFIPDSSITYSRSGVYFRGYSFTVSLASRSSDPFSVSVNVPAPDPPGPVDPDPPDPGPGPVEPDPPGPVVPGEGDFQYTEVGGAELAKDVVLGSGTATGGVSVFWEYDSYTVGTPPYEVTIPGGSSHQMAPSRFPSISLSKSGDTVTASIPSTSYTFSWDGGCRVNSFTSLLTGPPGFSGPGSSALDYVEFQLPIPSEKKVHNLELDGAVPVSSVYRAGSKSATRTGGVWSLYVNGALTASGTTDTYGKIQFSNFVYYSSEPVTALTLRFIPAAAGLSFPSNTGSITFSWSMSLNFKELSMVYLEGEDEAIDLDKFYQEVSNSQGSIDSYNKIENQWTENMTSNWNSLKMDEFTFDAGLISGFALLSGIFNDVWRAFGLFNVLWIVPLMLGIALLVIGRISRDGGTGKGSE